MTSNFSLYAEVVPYTPKDPRPFWRKFLRRRNPLTPPGINPEKAGLEEGIAYRILRINDYSDKGEVFFAVMNTKGKVFWVSSKFFQIYCLTEASLVTFRGAINININTPGTGKN